MDKKRIRLADKTRAGMTSGPSGPETSHFIKIEKNLAALGFFSPTSTKTLKKRREKILRLLKIGDEGQQIETSVKIVTGGNYGLPGTGDLDKYLALQKLINAIHKRTGIVENPICFTSWELLSLLGVRVRSGKNYQSVEEWLDRMYATTIEAKGVTILEGQKRHGKERIRVFDRIVSLGRELEKDVIADQNYVWLSKWLLDSINNNHLIPIDFDVYLTLKNPIAKTLVPLLQIWLYASRAASSFEKDYSALCQLLGINEYPNQSLITQKLGPSLTELQQYGYLASWELEKRQSGEGFKIVLRHGDKFYTDRALMGKQSQQQLSVPRTISQDEAQWLQQLLERGIEEGKARALVVGRVPGQHIGDQIEWIDNKIEADGRENYRNPPGLYIRLIELNAQIPSNFEPSRLRHAREEAQQRSVKAQADKFKLEVEYGDYVRGEIKARFDDLNTVEQNHLMEEARLQFEMELPDAAKVFKGVAAEGVIMSIVEKKLTPQLNLMSFEEFSALRDKEAAAE